MFDEYSTADEVLDGLDLRGWQVLVTGVSAGLGVETARALAARGAQVIGIARDLQKAEAATAEVRSAAQRGGGSLELRAADLSSLDSVRACADALVRDGRRLDLVIANAGIMACPFGKTVDGFEQQFGTNHLGHFLLVNRLAPLMEPGARLVMLSSAGHRFADVDLDDPQFDRTPYAEFVAYGRSKTANILFAVGFDRRHRAAGIRAAAVHPGAIQTQLDRHMSAQSKAQLIGSINERLATQGQPPFRYKTVPQGAATTVWAAVRAPADQVGGRYCEDCHVADIQDDGELRGGVRPYALDASRAEALWALSERLVGESFDVAASGAQ